MDKISFHKTKNINSSTHLSELENVCEKYPYFQYAKALLLKEYFTQDSFKYNNFLKKTAVCTIDRTVLFDYITDFNFVNKKEQNTASAIEEKPTKEKTLGSPISFQKTENYSFNQWLQLANTKPIDRTEEKESSNSNLLKNQDLINQFIETNPTIKPISKDTKPVHQAEISYNEEELMTETLAKVYLEQKKFNKAIKAYEILILKYPEKSGLFANLIREIEYIKNK